MKKFLFFLLVLFMFLPNLSGLVYAQSTGTFTTLVNDADGDGVENSNDVCSGTVADNSPTTPFTNPWGTQRWHFDGQVLTQEPNSAENDAEPERSMSTTRGCSCYQILKRLENEGLGKFGGHYKFGCSTGVLEDFAESVKGISIDGTVFIETVTVQANNPNPTYSIAVLGTGVNYKLVASGTATSGGITPGEVVEFDARYNFSTAGSIEWTDKIVSDLDDSYGEGFLDLSFIGIGTTPWGDYSADHTYEYLYTGEGNPLGFYIVDFDYSDNSGSLKVDIFAEL
jgi:hypothetical protein